MAELSRTEVCLGAKSWLDSGKGAGDGDAVRVYHCMCELGDDRPEDVVARLAESEEPLTLERVEDAWRRLTDEAARLRGGYL